MEDLFKIGVTAALAYAAYKLFKGEPIFDIHPTVPVVPAANGLVQTTSTVPVGGSLNYTESLVPNGLGMYGALFNGHTTDGQWYEMATKYSR